MEYSSRHSSSSSRSHSSRGHVRRSRSPSRSSEGSSNGSVYTRSHSRGRSSKGSDGITGSRHTHRPEYSRTGSMERREHPRYTNGKDAHRGKGRYYTSDVSPKFLNSDQEDWESSPGLNGSAHYGGGGRYSRSRSPSIQSRRSRSRSRAPIHSRRPRSPSSTNSRPHSPSCTSRPHFRSPSPDQFQAKRPISSINSSPPRRSTRCPTPPMPNRTSLGHVYSDPVFNSALENWDDGPTVNVNIKRNYTTGYAVVQPPWRKRPYESRSHAPSVPHPHSHRHKPTATAIETKPTNQVHNSEFEDWDSGRAPASLRKSPPSSSEPPKVKIKIEKIDDEQDEGIRIKVEKLDDEVDIKVEKLDDEVKIKVEKLDDEVEAEIKKVDPDEVDGAPAVAVDMEEGEIEPGEMTPSPMVPSPMLPSPLPPSPPPRLPPRSPSPEPLQARRIRRSVNEILPDNGFEDYSPDPLPTEPVRSGNWRSAKDYYQREPVVRYPNVAHELSDSYTREPVVRYPNVAHELSEPFKSEPVMRFPNAAHELSDPKSFEKKKFFKKRGYQKYDKHGTYGFDVNIDTDEPSPAEPLLPPPPPIPTPTYGQYKAASQVPPSPVSPLQQNAMYDVATFGVGPLGLLPHQIATLLPHQLAALVNMIPAPLQSQYQQPQIPVPAVQRIVRSVELPPPLPSRHSPPSHNGYAPPEMARRVSAVATVSGSDENWEEEVPIRNGRSSRTPPATTGRGKVQSPSGYRVTIDNPSASAAVLVRKNAVVFDYGHGSGNGFS